MRQALVLVAMLGCAPASDDTTGPRPVEARVIAFAGEMRDEVACERPGDVEQKPVSGSG